jgi:polyketide biosynthesis 3-hydroxy-3-methylglutaryl-CoA synthase-like enzyme PksG
MSVGIELMNCYLTRTYIDIKELFEARQLNLDRFSNLMMLEKSINLPCEDPVTNAVNSAKPIIDQLTEKERNSIELLITSSESGLDFGKSLSTYIHQYLGLSRHCRLFEIKQACYAGTAALQMAMDYVASEVSPGAKALVISADVARAAAKLTYAEPSQGAASVAMLVSDNPVIFEADFGANGIYSYEVMDTCRPLPEIETGDPDLSLLVYMECLEHAYKHYASKMDNVDFATSFDYLAFHTPFVGLAKAAHKRLMREITKADPQTIEADFVRRMLPATAYCRHVGNIYSGSLYLALCGTIDTADFDSPKRVGLFSYGSGCSSEFYSGVITPESTKKLNEVKIKEHLDTRYKLSIPEYDKILDLNMEWTFGIQDKKVDVSPFQDIYDKQFADKRLLTLKEVNNYHREYDWS